MGREEAAAGESVRSAVEQSVRHHHGHKSFVGVCFISTQIMSAIPHRL